MPAPAGKDMLGNLIAAYIKAHQSDKTDTPTWDTTGALKFTWVENVGEWLPDVDPD